jgi:hypothetical protein
MHLYALRSVPFQFICFMLLRDFHSILFVLFFGFIREVDEFFSSSKSPSIQERLVDCIIFVPLYENLCSLQ